LSATGHASILEFILTIVSLVKVFFVRERLAHALKTSPPGRTRIKIMFEENGREVINDIGEGTVQAWKTVYYEAIEPNQAVR
jgi:hypothetical protein